MRPEFSREITSSPAAKKPELDALLHHPHELAVIDIQDPALAAL
jgi:hypothetical protein